MPPIKSKPQKERPEAEEIRKATSVYQPQTWSDSARVRPIRHKSVDSESASVKNAKQNSASGVFYGGDAQGYFPGKALHNFTTGYQQQIYYQPGEVQVVGLPYVAPSVYPIYPSQPATYFRYASTLFIINCYSQVDQPW